MPYMFGGLVVLNALMLGYYLFLKQPSATQSVEQAKADLVQPIEFSNSALYIPPRVGSKD